MRRKRVDTPEEMLAVLSAEKWDLIIADYDLPLIHGQQEAIAS